MYHNVMVWIRVGKYKFLGKTLTIFHRKSSASVYWA
jgi:hypothetical protein